jgi:hypothetical protein
MDIRCFFIEPTNMMKVYLQRRHAPNWIRAKLLKKCPAHNGMHAARVFVREMAITDSAGNVNHVQLDDYMDDHRWPAACDCGKVFDVMDPYNVDEIFEDVICQDTTTGKKMPFSKAIQTPGCMWDDFSPHAPKDCGPDGLKLCVVCPGGEVWNLDGRSKDCVSRCVHCKKPYKKCNCKKPHFEDSDPEHRCWVRNGAPPHITVEWNNLCCYENIATPRWKGNLINGVLVAA